MKLALIGASPYGPLPAFLGDLIHAKRPLDTLVLVEPNSQLLALELPLLQRVLREAGQPTEALGTRSPLAALGGADLVLFAASQGDPLRREADLLSLETVLKEAPPREAMADLMYVLRAGAVLGSLLTAMGSVCPGAVLLLSLSQAAPLTQVAADAGFRALGMEAQPPPALSPQGQQQAQARLAKLSLEGLSPTGWELLRDMQENADFPQMAAALALLGSGSVTLPRAAYPLRWLEDTPAQRVSTVVEGPVRLSGGKLRSQGENPASSEDQEEAILLRTLTAQAARGDRTALRELIEIHPALYGTDRLLTLDLLLSLIDTQTELLPQFADGE